MRYYTVFPEFTTVSVGNNTVSPVHGTLSVGHTAARSQVLDMTMRRAFKFGNSTIDPRLDFFNMTNAATIIARTTQLGPTCGQAGSIQGGTLIKAGFDISF